MGELHRALGDIQSIRRQVAGATEFRGYGPAALAGTAVLAVVGALLQALLVPEPMADPRGYFAVWVGTAACSVVLAGVTMWTRSRRLHSGLSDVMIGMAVQQFAPVLVAGSLVTLVLARCAAAQLWMMPGLWMVLFSLGIFASCRFLPKLIATAGAWYLLTGLLSLGLGDARALSPWTMGFAFFAGQMWIAGVLWTAGKVLDEEDGDGFEEAE
ncbi:hypothetical protein [Terriglobus aquaticus]|uniref:Uncharacterized protein n=1 Tax=Terriglobus aquaticus TaxID=940139 RepID=A0ABW9KMA5_9BACT|nr:hypothetical protein [Terriglobus aquaticus]